jgi:hypothetical protein
MSTVITKNGRVVRSALASHDLFPQAKRVITRQFHKAVRRDAQNIIREQLEEPIVSLQEQRLVDLQEEANRMDRTFWGWFYMDEHEREMARLEERQQEQLQDLLDWENRHIHGLS